MDRGVPWKRVSPFAGRDLAMSIEVEGRFPCRDWNTCEERGSLYGKAFVNRESVGGKISSDARHDLRGGE